MGQTAYFGPAGDSLGYFARQGHEPEGMVNPADYLLEASERTKGPGARSEALNNGTSTAPYSRGN